MYRNNNKLFHPLLAASLAAFNVFMSLAGKQKGHPKCKKSHFNEFRNEQF